MTDEDPAAVRTQHDVNLVSPTTLALMTRAQVDALSRAARARRVEILLNDRTTTWVLHDIARYCGVKWSSAHRWFWRWSNGQEVNGRITVLLEPLVEQRRGRPGRPGPQWLMSDILRWAAQDRRADRTDYVSHPKKRTGRAPDGYQTPNPVPAQRRSSVDAKSTATVA